MTSLCAVRRERHALSRFRLKPEHVRPATLLLSRPAVPGGDALAPSTSRGLGVGFIDSKCIEECQASEAAFQWR